MKRRVLSFILSLSLVLGMAVSPVYAAPEASEGQETEEAAAEETVTDDAESAVEPETEEKKEETEETTERNTSEKQREVGVQPEAAVYSVDTVDVSDVSPYSVTAEEEVDTTSSPELAAAEAELSTVEVQDEDGNSVALTEEQIQNVLYMYKQYLDQWAANANVLGVQVPFFLQFNDKKDSLGGLGEMLVLAGYTVDDVRDGNYSYDDLMGMIQNFYYADKFAISEYSEAIVASREEAVAAVEASGAKTMIQKILVLNDWLAHETTFDMSYIMNMGKETPMMVAENPQKHEKYDMIYAEIESIYHDQIKQQFHDMIYDGVVTQLRQQYYENAIQNIIYQNELGKDEADANEEEKASAKEAAEIFMEDNAEAISEDANAFVEAAFGPEAAAQLSAGADAFIASAKENGIEVAEGVTMTVEQLVEQQMDQPLADLGGMTPNQAVEVFTQQAADGLSNGIINAWLGNHVGVLAEGEAVCAGYSKAFSYLLQYMTPEVYGVNGDRTDMSVSKNWKTAEDLYYSSDELDINSGYIVDMVRITYDASVSMFGVKSDENFNAEHFWNAVKVDGEWYYVDPCYTDIYVECMSRDRVEIDGSMNHMYFMFSDTTARKMYDGNMKEIKSLYEGIATDTNYESAWFSRAASNTYSDGTYFYYTYDSTDMLNIMREYGNGSGNSGSNMGDYSEITAMKNPEYRLVRHAITDSDKGDGDNDYDTLIAFNVNRSDDDETKVAKVLQDGELVENETLTKLFAKYKDECSIYPSIKITSALHNGKLYFNLSNWILSYDLETGAVCKVKEYTTVNATRDKTVALGGLAFNVTSGEADLSVENHPIASMTIKGDQMYVSIATNYAYISGKENVEDTSSYGYEFEESNYNPDYSTFANDSDYAGTGYEKETNDNDEFMWSAVFKDTFTVPAPGDKISADNVTIEECDHHYVHFDETYYTRVDEDDSSSAFNTGDCYVCTKCGYAVEEGDDGSADDWDETKDTYEDAAAKAGHIYEPTDAEWTTTEDGDTYVTFSELKCSSVCPDKKDTLDCLIADGKTSVKLKEAETKKAKATSDGTDCTAGGSITYTASGTVTVKGVEYKYTATKAEKGTQEAGKHVFDNDQTKFTWNDTGDKDEAGNVIYTATAHLVCSVCRHEYDVDAVVTSSIKEATCEKAGRVVYKAKATATDENTDEQTTTTKVVGTATETREVVKGDALGHDYKAAFDWTEEKDDEGNVTDYTAATVTLTCSRSEKHGETAKCTISKTTTDATCTMGGTVKYTAKATVDGKDYTDTKTITIPALGHTYGDPEFEWSKTDDGDYVAYATRTCETCGHGDGPVKCKVTSKTAKAKCETSGKIKYYATCKFDGDETEYKATKSVALDPIGHNYDFANVEYTWREKKDEAGNVIGYEKEVKATVTCTHDKSHTVTKTATAETVSDAGTCEEKGKVTYTATFDFSDVGAKEPLSDTKVIEGEALGHDWKATFNWADDYASATADFKCARCDEAKTGVECKVAELTDQYKEPSYTEDGKIVYKASCEWDGKTYTDPKEVVIPKKDANTKFSKSSVTVYAGDKTTVTLNSDYTDDKLVSVTSSMGKEYATVSFSGNKMTVNGKKAGTGTVTAKTASNETVKLKVTVKAAISETQLASDIKKVKDGSLSGSTFRVLCAKTSNTKTTSTKISWKEVSDADGYIIYANRCGSSYTMKKIKTINKGSTTSYTYSKLKKGTYYKIVVVAYKNNYNNKKLIIAKSKTIHTVTNGSKYANPSAVKPKVTSKTLSAGSTYKISTSVKLARGKKMSKHRNVYFESSNTSVATVSSSKGTATIKVSSKAKKGDYCYIYAYAQNGVYKSIKITVK